MQSGYRDFTPVVLLTETTFRFYRLHPSVPSWQCRRGAVGTPPYLIDSPRRPGHQGMLGQCARTRRIQLIGPEHQPEAVEGWRGLYPTRLQVAWHEVEADKLEEIER
jgi:hypothetical protein